MPNQVDMIRKASRALTTAARVTVFTGAGISAESGIPTYRDGASALWGRFRPEDLVTPEAFARNPALVWGWHMWLRQQIRSVEPNDAHRAVARLEQRAANLRVLTQNIDDLHERSGSPDVLHLHGDISSARCCSCGQSWQFPGHEQELPADATPIVPPACLRCGERVRPGVVWFGESLDPRIHEEAVALARSSDLMLVVGTSGSVYPAAGIPLAARRSGALVIQINEKDTPLDSVCHMNIRARAEKALPRLLEATQAR